MSETSWTIALAPRVRKQLERIADRAVKNPALPGGASQINFSCSGALALCS